LTRVLIDDLSEIALLYILVLLFGYISVKLWLLYIALFNKVNETKVRKVYICINIKRINIERRNNKKLKHFIYITLPSNS
jgi:hypothetical protein